MDPDANLAEQLRLTKEIMKIVDAIAVDGQFTKRQTAQLSRLGHELAELVEALNEWLAHGGFLPKAWGKGRSSLTMDAGGKL